MLHRRLPITAWLPLYTWPFFFQDLLAGVTVALTEIPQGIAYAIVAGNKLILYCVCSIFFEIFKS